MSLTIFKVQISLYVDIIYLSSWEQPRSTLICCHLYKKARILNPSYQNAFSPSEISIATPLERKKSEYVVYNGIASFTLAKTSDRLNWVQILKYESVESALKYSWCCFSDIWRNQHIGTWRQLFVSGVWCHMASYLTKDARLDLCKRWYSLKYTKTGVSYWFSKFEKISHPFGTMAGLVSRIESATRWFPASMPLVERQLVRKLDWLVLPYACLSFFVKYLDVSALSMCTSHACFENHWLTFNS